MPDLARLAERQVPDAGRVVDAWMHRFLGPAGNPRTLNLLETVTQAVKSDFTYCSRTAEGTQTPAETLERGSGTCRDFALLMMEAVRSLGLAARFVTGYLYDTGTQQRRAAAPPTPGAASTSPGPAGWNTTPPTGWSPAPTSSASAARARPSRRCRSPAGSSAIRPTRCH